MASSASAIIDLGDDDLQFTETTPPGGSAGAGSSGGGTTHTFGHQLPDSAVDDDVDDDRAGLLDGKQKQGYNFFSVEYYQRFFDVDTDEVGARIRGAVIPIPGRSFLMDVTKRRPDLYGPFWICATLVVSVAVTGNMASYLQSAWHTGGQGFEWHYDFHKVTLAATAVFSYAWLVPAGLYAFLWWTASTALAAVGFLDLICLYGYSLSIYIPVSILWLIQYSAVQWALVLVGAGLSGAVIVMTLHPIFKESSSAKSGLLIILVVIGLHFLLACGFMLYFFHAPASLNSEPAIVTNDTKVADSGSGIATDGNEADDTEKEKEKADQVKRTAEVNAAAANKDAGGDGKDDDGSASKEIDRAPEEKESEEKAPAAAPLKVAPPEKQEVEEEPRAQEEEVAKEDTVHKEGDDKEKEVSGKDEDEKKNK